MAISAPYTVPVLPRMSSSTSGFRFCGIMLDDVQNASSMRMKPNSFDEKMIQSSARRDRCAAIRAQSKMNSAQKSRSLTASMLL